MRFNALTRGDEGAAVEGEGYIMTGWVGAYATTALGLALGPRLGLALAPFPG